jgi:hypothetical protein
VFLWKFRSDLYSKPYSVEASASSPPSLDAAEAAIAPLVAAVVFARAR